MVAEARPVTLLERGPALEALAAAGAAEIFDRLGARPDLERLRLRAVMPGSARD
jgi:hypothetical protein